MTYWQMDDKFLGHHKTVRALRAGAEALQMWIALRSYVANNESDGVIPDGDIDDLPGAPKNPRRWLKVLVECGKPAIGTEERGAGFVDVLQGAWKIHNYEKRGLSRAQIDAKRDADRTRKERWKERQPGTHQERRSEHVPNASRTPSGASPRVRAPAGALPSHPIPSHDQTEEDDPKDLTGCGAGELAQPSTHALADPQGNWDGSDRETVCPTDLVQRAIAAGVPRALAEALRADEASVLDALREFVGYWTIGGGSGQRRRHWMRKARESVRKSAEQNKLKPPGAIEHELREAEAPLSAEYLAQVDARLTKARARAEQESEVGGGK